MAGVSSVLSPMLHLTTSLQKGPFLLCCPWAVKHPFSCVTKWQIIGYFRSKQISLKLLWMLLRLFFFSSQSHLFFIHIFLCKSHEHFFPSSPSASSNFKPSKKKKKRLIDFWTPVNVIRWLWWLEKLFEILFKVISFLCKIFLYFHLGLVLIFFFLIAFPSWRFSD